MIFLEIVMVLIGIGAIYYSFKFAEDKKEDKVIEKVNNNEEISKLLSEKEKEISSSLDDKAKMVYEKTEDDMEKLSNDKILGISEYSDQVIDKIEKNHGEVVFLYDMMNSKQDEIQDMIHEIDSAKAEFRDEIALGYQKLKEQEKLLTNIRNDIEKESVVLQERMSNIEEEKAETKTEKSIEKSESIEENEHPFDYSDMDEIIKDIAKEIPDEVSDNDTSSVIDAEIARIEQQEKDELLRESKKTSENYTPLSMQEKEKNHNSEIISLYKKGRSIIEISKMLSLGQGEVKFVIDLYKAR